MANVIDIAGVRYELRPDGRTWGAVGHDDAAGMVALLDEFTRGVPFPGPQDGFVTPGAFAARDVAAHFGGTVVEADPPPAPGGDAEGRVY